jgi:hypothetical protein
LIELLDLAPGGVPHRARNVDLELQERHKFFHQGDNSGTEQFQKYCFSRAPVPP